MNEREVVVGTRGSALALRQTRAVVSMLEAAARRHGLPWRFTVRVLRTRGDVDRNTPLARFGDRGVFVREVEDALRRREVDMAVHSLKDLPVPAPEQAGFGEAGQDLVVGAVPVREDPRDCLVMARPLLSGTSPAAGDWPQSPALLLSCLPHAATVGTGSPRRAAHLRHWRPDLTFIAIRGNIDTRLRRLDQGDLAAVVLAAAGLRRLSLWDERMLLLPPDVCLPAPGQGALAVQVRAGDADLQRVAALIDDPAVRAAVAAERALLALLGGGCHVPVGALAEWSGDGSARSLRLSAAVAAPDGSRVVRAARSAPPGAGSPEQLARRVAEELWSQGARELLENGAGR
ncbi:MAG: hydroxymethylbilane synthase [Firmicutes bacterium]|nr:hydroxymethylbilane synthase [Bacillota bacterium]